MAGLNLLLFVVASFFITIQTVNAAKRPNAPGMKKSKYPAKINYPASFPDGFVIGFPKLVSPGKAPQGGAVGGVSPGDITGNSSPGVGFGSSSPGVGFGGSSPGIIVTSWSPNGRCGKEFGYKCPGGQCCSFSGWWYVPGVIKCAFIF